MICGYFVKVGFFHVIMEPHQTSQHDESQSVGDCWMIKIEQDTEHMILGGSAICLRPHPDL